MRTLYQALEREKGMSIKEHAALSVEVIVCFESTSQAIMAEQALVEQAFYVRVMPKPADIKAGCGFCLRFLPETIEKVVEFLSKCGINVKEAYRMEESDGTVSYSRVSL
jgi:hypothetical protein